MKNKGALYLTQAALIGAMYFALTWMSNFLGWQTEQFSFAWVKLFVSFRILYPRLCRAYLSDV